MTDTPQQSQPPVDQACNHHRPTNLGTQYSDGDSWAGADCRRRALITGITGQDGSYLAEFLLDKGYEVHGLVRRTSTSSTGRIDHLLAKYTSTQHSARLALHHGDLGDGLGLAAIVNLVRPHEVYHLAAQSDVRLSFDQPLVTAEVVGMGTLRMLEAVRHHIDCTGASVRFYQASSSEMFGNARTTPQDETTPFEPCSPYGIAKLFAHRCAVSYREAHGMYVCSGILFNHESPRRGENFVTRKVALAAARIRRGLQTKLVLGNLDARRDWGFTGDYVEAMWRMMQEDSPGEYVIATGRSHSVRELCELAFGRVGLDYREHVETDHRLLRPNEVHCLCGNAVKAERELGWTPRMSFELLIHRMVDADLERIDRETRVQTLSAQPSQQGEGSYVVA